MRNKTWLCFPTIQAAALLQVAAGAGWSTVALTAVAALGLLHLPQPDRIPGWLEETRSIWGGVLIGQVLGWFVGCWPGNSAWISASLLILALWQTGKGSQATAAAASVLAIFQLVLIVGVLAVGIQNGELKGLKPEFPALDGWLLTVLLLPALSCQEERKSIWPGIWALLFCLVVRAVIPANGIPERGNAFWEMSRSISVFGKIRRMESLTAVGLSIGFYTLVCYLLGAGEKKGSIPSGLPALVGFLTFLASFELPGIYAATISGLFWIVLPMIVGIIQKKRGK